MADRIGAVFFDLDGTLVRDGAMDAAGEAIRSLVERYPALDAVALRAANDEVWSGCWREQGEQWMLGALADDALAREVWRRTLERVAPASSAAGDGMLEAAVLLHVEAEKRTFTLFEESRAVLRGLRRRGIRVGVITNGPSAFQRAKLAAAGIDGLFDLVVASGDIGVMKPDAQIFAHAVTSAGVTASAALHVGDNFEADVSGAVGAGLAALWINRDGLLAPRDDVPHRVGASLHAVLDLVA